MPQTTPHTMQQINMREAGAPDVLFIEQATVPTPQAGELLVKVAYAGVNRPDIMQRQGLYPMPKALRPLWAWSFQAQWLRWGRRERISARR